MQHPSDEKWFDEESARHRASCAICRDEHDRIENALAGLGVLSRDTTDLPEFFWERQRLAIQSRLKTSQGIHNYRSAWTWAAATTLVLLVLLVLSPNSTQSVVPDIVAGDDQELLIGIERSLNRELPEALQPASLLTQEIVKAPSRTAPK